MQQLIYIFLFLAALDAALFYCAFEKWWRSAFSSRCRYCFSFWFCVLQVLAVATACSLSTQITVPWWTYIPCTFLLHGLSGIFYFYIKQAYQ